MAYRPDNPALTVVLIPHAPLAGPGFWTRPRRSGRTAMGRVALYEPIVPYVPCLALFADRGVATALAEVIEASGIQARMVGRLGGILTRLAQAGQAPRPLEGTPAPLSALGSGSVPRRIT
ncbi:MAG: hypothetical protein M3Z04_14320 [Chloroflexota bacterium]|nr:hypothetical protein [Chloroflexota bacterium]